MVSIRGRMTRRRSRAWQRRRCRGSWRSGPTRARALVLPGSDRDALEALIVKMGPLPPVGDLDAAQILDAVARDKKVVDGTLHYVRPTSIGDTTIATDVSGAELQKALRTVGLRGT